MRRRDRKHAAIEPNLTSLIDVTFLLIVFFVLVSRLAEVESAPLELPKPIDAASHQLQGEHQATINVLRGSGGQAAGYRLDGTDFAPEKTGLDAMTARLVSLYKSNPRLNINVRADRSTHYEYVEPAMQAVSTAARGVPAVAAAQGGAARINLVVVKEN